MAHFLDINNVDKILNEDIKNLHSELLDNGIITEDIQDDKYKCMSNLISAIDPTVTMSFYTNNQLYLFLPMQEKYNSDIMFYHCDNINEKVFSKAKKFIKANNLYNKTNITNFTSVIPKIREVDYKQKMIYDKETETASLPDSIIFTIDKKQSYYIL